MHKNISTFCIVISAISFFLSGCVAGIETVEKRTITGEATLGAPLAGIVTIRDSSVPYKEIVTTTQANGGYHIDVAEMKAPFTIEVSGFSGGTGRMLHTVVNEAGVVNVNPLTEVAVSSAAGGDSAESVFNSFEHQKLKKVSDSMPRILAALGTKLKPLLNEFGITVDEATGHHQASNEALRALFASVEFIHSNGTFMVVNRASSSVIFTCRINDISGGVFTAGNIPAFRRVPSV